MILVTGGTGLVGAHLLLHIIQDEVPHNLRCELPIDRLPLSKRPSLCLIATIKAPFDRIDWVQADILDILP
jgi:nucleoside-diphosphate-sugar epimerase